MEGVNHPITNYVGVSMIKAMCLFQVKKKEKKKVYSTLHFISGSRKSTFFFITQKNCSIRKSRILLKKK